MIRNLLTGLVAAAALASFGAQAGTVYSANLNGLGEQASPGEIDTAFAAAAAGNGTLSFELAGYSSLDGANNCCSDVFHLAVNGTEVFTGSFNLGGGGDNTVTLAPVGATALTTTFGATDDVHHSNQITWAGGVTEISLPVALVAGNNTLSFSYTGAAQGLGDEAWGINAVNVSAVPEPETVALMLAGLGLLTVVARRKN